MKRFQTFVTLVLFLPLMSLLSVSSVVSVLAGYELPPGERITNLPHIPRSMPQKEAYEIYDPVIGRNFDLKNFWMRADLRIRPEFRNGVCFGGGNPAGGACNASPNQRGAQGQAVPNAGATANDFYVQQWVRLGIGYDLSPDVNFYFEVIDNAVWGGNGNPANAGNGGDPLNHNCAASNVADAAPGNPNNGGGCRLGVRAAYMLVRNMFNVPGLSMKAGRQYIVFGNHSLFGHFDWANTGYSHDGIMFQYSTKSFDSHLGWFRNSEGDLLQGSPVGSGGGNVVGGQAGTANASGDVDMFIFYNQIKSVPGMLIEPFYVLYMNGLPSGTAAGGTGAATTSPYQGLGTAKHSNQVRHMLGNRTELRKDGWDFINETAWQFGRMGDSAQPGPGGVGTVPNPQQRNLTINAWATRNWLGYTFFEHKWKPRFAVGFDYASGDGNANCTLAGAIERCRSANTFENFFPTNYIHAGYMLNHAWKNSIQPQVNIQARPTERDHVEFWGQRHYLANARDNWYRGAQGVLVFSRPNNTSTHVGDEVDFAWTHMFADGKVAITATWGHFFAGEYVSRNLGTSSDQDWGILQFWMNF